MRGEIEAQSWSIDSASYHKHGLKPVPLSAKGILLATVLRWHIDGSIRSASGVLTVCVHVCVCMQ